MGIVQRAVDLWTDGACSGHGALSTSVGRGAGGWAAVIASGGTKLAISGYVPDTTNNRMEMIAVIEGLRALGDVSASVTIYIDSSYVKNAHTQGWIAKWKRSGWKNTEGKDVANRDLWEQMLEIMSNHMIKWRHVKGHTKLWSLNHVVDEMAVAAKLSGVGVTTLLD